VHDLVGLQENEFEEQEGLTLSREPMDDDAERDIGNDSILSALHSDLEAASRRTDNRLVVFIGAGLIFVSLPIYVHVQPWIVYALALLSFVCIIGGIAYTIWSVMQRKRAVASRYGLLCSACGRLPKLFQVLQAAELRQCPRCRNALNVHLPAMRNRT
jgi:hypothetical protein